jgi:hypothetical protein
MQRKGGDGRLTALKLQTLLRTQKIEVLMARSISITRHAYLFSLFAVIPGNPPYFPWQMICPVATFKAASSEHQPT